MPFLEESKRIQHAYNLGVYDCNSDKMGKMYITDAIRRGVDHSDSFKESYKKGFYSCDNPNKIDAVTLTNFIKGNKTSFLLVINQNEQGK